MVGQLIAGLFFLVCMTASLWVVPVAAEDLRIIVPELPPMIDKDGKGHEATLIIETLATCGHQVEFHVVPFSRHWADYRPEANGFDAVATVPPGLDLPGYASDDYISYQNGASVLKDSGLDIEALADLKGKRVVTFAGGKDILPGVRDVVANFTDFREIADQLIHSAALFARRTDVVLSDGLIIAEYNRQFQERFRVGDKLAFNPMQPVAFTAIFPPSPYHMVFRDAPIRDDFNRCLAQLKAEGRVDAIMREAVERHRATVGSQYLNY